VKRLTGQTNLPIEHPQRLAPERFGEAKIEQNIGSERSEHYLDLTGELLRTGLAFHDPVINRTSILRW